MVDLSFLKEFSKGKTSRMHRYINLCLEMAPETFNQIESALNSGDWEAYAIQAHSLKPQAKYMGITGLQEILAQMEKLAKAGETGDLASLFQEAKALHLEALPILQNEING